MTYSANRDSDCRRARAALFAVIALLGWLAGARADEPPEDHRCLALSLYFEARSEGDDGMLAVGWTILNRVQSQDFPQTPCDVVRQGGERPPCQFSWWCDGRSDRPREQASWETALAVAARLLNDPPPDPTGGALYFHNHDVLPGWAQQRTQTAQIGGHVFYR